MPILPSQTEVQYVYTLDNYNLLKNTSKKSKKNSKLEYHKSKDGSQKFHPQSYLRQQQLVYSSFLNKSRQKDLHSSHRFPKYQNSNYKVLANIQNLSPANCCCNTVYLHKCPYLKRYLKSLSHTIKEQSKKKEILKRRNKELTNQNKVLNQYFNVFQKRYDEMVKRSNNDHENNSKVNTKSKSISKIDGLYFSFKDDFDKLKQMSKPGKTEIEQEYTRKTSIKEINKGCSFLTNCSSNKREKDTFQSSGYDFLNSDE